MLYFKQLELGPMQNFVYLIGDPQTREAVVVDPGWEVQRIVRTLQEDDYRLGQIWITHAHADHILGLQELLDHVDVPVIIHEYERDFLPVDPVAIKAIADGDELRFGEIVATCLHTPGHSVGSVCYLIQGHLITGDTLFIKGCGRTDLPGGDTQALYESLCRLTTLDDECILYPGHHYSPAGSISLGEEKRTSPILQQPSFESFLHLLGISPER